MLDRLTNLKTVIILIIARILTGLVSMPSGDGAYSSIDSLFRIISTLLMVLILVIALHALGNYSKSKEEDH